MPILLPAQADNQPMEQGDVLGEIQTYVADHMSSDPAPIMDEGLVLVISRPCNALRSKRLVVAEVVKRSLAGLKGAETLREIKVFFVTVRDGDGTPDTFYLGELEPGPDRYFAKLDSLRTIQVPDDEGARQAFIKRHRRFKLNPEFARDLHVRIFKAYASLGFDDDGWWTDADLDLSCRKGEADVAALRAAVQALEAQLDVLKTAEGSKKELKQNEEQLKEKRGALASAEKELDPLLIELKKRGRRPEG
jgi:hypothetical protein